MECNLNISKKKKKEEEEEEMKSLQVQFTVGETLYLNEKGKDGIWILIDDTQRKFKTEGLNDCR